MDYLAAGGTLSTASGVPDWVKDVYATSPEISPESHVLMQAAFQKSCDSGISKTINFANSATKQDIEHSYILAWEKGCKGITVYRAGSREKEVLVKVNADEKQLPLLGLGAKNSRHPCCDKPTIVMESGCEVCKACGWSACLIS